MDRKGLISAKLVVLILTALALIILGYFTVSYAGILWSSGEESICKVRLEMVSTKIAGFNLVTTLKEYCREEKIVLKELNEEEVFEQIAKKMEKCWNRYGGGEKDFTGAWGKIYGESYTGCFHCYEISFHDLDIPEHRLKYDGEKKSYYFVLEGDLNKYLKNYFKKKGLYKDEKYPFFYTHPSGSETGNRLYLDMKYKIYQYYVYYGVPAPASAGRMPFYTSFDVRSKQQFRSIYPPSINFFTRLGVWYTAFDYHYPEFVDVAKKAEGTVDFFVILSQSMPLSAKYPAETIKDDSGPTYKREMRECGWFTSDK